MTEQELNDRFGREEQRRDVVGSIETRRAPNCINNPWLDPLPAMG